MTEAIGSMVEPLAWLANAAFKPAWKPGLAAVVTRRRPTASHEDHEETKIRREEED